MKNSIHPLTKYPANQTLYYLIFVTSNKSSSFLTFPFCPDNVNKYVYLWWFYISLLNKQKTKTSSAHYTVKSFV